jgi:hypothetical protein
MWLLLLAAAAGPRAHAQLPFKPPANFKLFPGALLRLNKTSAKDYANVLKPLVTSVSHAARTQHFPLAARQRRSGRAGDALPQQ